MCEINEFMSLSITTNMIWKILIQVNPENNYACMFGNGRRFSYSWILTQKKIIKRIVFIWMFFCNVTTLGEKQHTTSSYIGKNLFAEQDQTHVPPTRSPTSDWHFLRVPWYTVKRSSFLWLAIRDGTDRVKEVSHLGHNSVRRYDATDEIMQRAYNSFRVPYRCVGCVGT